MRKDQRVMSDYNTVDIDFQSINNIGIGNVVYFQNTIWQIYDIEDDMIYIKSPGRTDMGVPKDEITPILLSPEIMMLCGFTISSQDSTPQYHIGVDIIQTKTQYTLYKEFSNFVIDMKLNVVMNYKLKDDEYFIDTISSLDTNDTNLIWLHQVQNMFRSLYKFELFEIDYDNG